MTKEELIGIIKNKKVLLFYFLDRDLQNTI